MRWTIKILIALILILSLCGVNFANDVKIEGLLTEATKNYIVVDGYEYSVTNKTVISDISAPEYGFPYNPKLFPHKQEVEIIVENNVVKKIFIRVPK